MWEIVSVVSECVWKVWNLSSQKVIAAPIFNWLRIMGTDPILRFQEFVLPFQAVLV